jgi:hypothetical protein
MKRIMYILLIASILLSACAPALTVPAPMLVKNLIRLCSDQRQGPIQLFGSDSMRTLVQRVIGGGSSMPFEGELAAITASESTKIGELFLFSHIEEGCADLACGGLKAAKSVIDGKAITIPEVAKYVDITLPIADPYLAMRQAVPQWIKQGSKQGVAFLADNVSGKITPVIIWKNGNVVSEIGESAWSKYLAGKISLPSLGTADLSADANLLISRNVMAMPNYSRTALKLGYAKGQPFKKIYITQTLSWEMATVVDDGFTVASVGQRSLLDIQSGMAYSFSHAPKDTTVALLTRDWKETSQIVESLNSSPTATSFISSTNWKGTIKAIVRGVENKFSELPLRLAELPLKKLYMPIMGSSMDVTIPASRAAFESQIGKIGIKSDEGVLSAVWTKVGPYVGKVLRVVAVASTIFIVYDVANTMNDMGNILFAFGPVITVQTGFAFPTSDSKVLEKIKVPVQSPKDGTITFQPAWWLSLGSNTLQVLTVGDVWLKGQKLLLQGETACGNFSLSDPRVPNLLMVTDLIYTETPSVVSWCVSGSVNNPDAVTFYNSITGANVVYAFDVTAKGSWKQVSGDLESLRQELSTNQFPSVRCWENFTTVPDQRQRIIFSPHCEGK